MTTRCVYGEILTEIFDCVYPDRTTRKVIHECDGNLNTTLSSSCPKKMIYPTCHVIAGSSCILANYTSNTVTCLCDMCGSSTSGSTSRMLGGKKGGQDADTSGSRSDSLAIQQISGILSLTSS